MNTGNVVWEDGRMEGRGSGMIAISSMLVDFMSSEQKPLEDVTGPAIVRQIFEDRDT